VANNLTVTPLLLELFHHPELWEGDDIRRTYSADSPHKATQDVLVRFSDTDDPNIGDQLQCEWLPATAHLPAAKELAMLLMRSYRGEQLGRVMITRLPPGKEITPHADTRGKYANFYSRYHVPLQSDPGCVFDCGEERVHMQPGEVWWFNGHLTHAVINNSSRDRLNLIVDLRSA
jgi:hypothetical protein